MDYVSLFVWAAVIVFFVTAVILAMRGPKMKLSWNTLLLPYWMAWWIRPPKPRWIYYVLIPFGLALFLLGAMMSARHTAG